MRRIRWFGLYTATYRFAPRVLVAAALSDDDIKLSGTMMFAFVLSIPYAHADKTKDREERNVTSQSAPSPSTLPLAYYPSLVLIPQKKTDFLPRSHDETSLPFPAFPMPRTTKKRRAFSRGYFCPSPHADEIQSPHPPEICSRGNLCLSLPSQNIRFPTPKRDMCPTTKSSTENTFTKCAPPPLTFP